ncbi:uncharacterized protein N7503_005078 [Penicillium pulvis]|uniref:uncharacterized protein n=1 Tax=Penicillium pulvis TaxID=1562058 RepID=UPI002547EC13|nr:uncharacterized protein N7503_005078 [Penicillium pulvis]KAJ5802628.1 hypothetical protein N7503_005078 [Penicillium pulvis]
MTLEFHIQTKALPFPFKNDIPSNNPVFPPKHTYLASLTSSAKAFYDQLRAQQWTDEECLEYFVEVNKSSGFAGAWLRHKGWPEASIQQWSEACQQGFIAPVSVEESSPGERDFNLNLAILRETVRRRKLYQEMEERIFMMNKLKASL